MPRRGRSVRGTGIASIAGGHEPYFVEGDARWWNRRTQSHGSQSAGCMKILQPETLSAEIALDRNPAGDHDISILRARRAPSRDARV